MILTADEKYSTRVEAKWALVVAAVAFITPCLLFFAGPTTPDGTTPEWVLWVILLVWILAGSLGIAGVIAGGRVRRNGAALIVGDATGALLFFVSNRVGGSPLCRRVRRASPISGSAGGTGPSERTLMPLSGRA